MNNSITKQTYCELPHVVKVNNGSVSKSRFFSLKKGNVIVTDVLLGGGNFGVVVKGIYTTYQQVETVAVKIVNSAAASVSQEVKIMQILNEKAAHENVVKFLGVYQNDEKILHICLEFCKCDLLFLLRSLQSTVKRLGHEKSLDIPQGWASLATALPHFIETLCVWSFQLTDAMCFISSAKIIHGDLAARNILLSNDGICKLSDFGLSTTIKEDDKTQNPTDLPLPWRWLAIETLEGTERLSFKSDVWSYGITLWEIFSLGSQPYDDVTDQNYILTLLKLNCRLNCPVAAKNTDMYQIMLDCWKEDPKMRPDFTQLKERLKQYSHGKISKDILNFENLTH